MITIWDLQKGESLLTLPGSQEGPVSGLAFVEKGKMLATARETKMVTLWDLSEL